MAPLPPEVVPEQPRVGGWAMVKTLCIRMFIIYLVSSVFRRGTQTPPAEGGADGAGAKIMGPSANLFQRSTLLVR